MLTLGALGISVALLLGLLALGARYRRLQSQIAGQVPRVEEPLATAGAAAAAPAWDPATMRTPVDYLLPRHPVAFYLLVLVVSAGCWGVGLAITPSVPRFLQSTEWHIQPFYLAAHLIALRLFVQLFVHKYIAGAAQLDISEDTVVRGIRRVLGLPGGLLSVAIAVPFCVLDYLYLVSAEYVPVSDDRTLHAIDYVMWGIWCAEWLLNAFIWVILAGFLAMSYRALRAHRFRAPIDTVVQQRLYRPFLQMSSQGATIVLGFACVTAFYIWYAGGEASDYLGLGVTGVLLVVGFIPSWALLKGKVRRTVREEIEALRRNLPVAMTGEKVLHGGPDQTRARTVDERLDEIVAMMRAWHLERLQLDVGRTEAQAMMVRLAAPAATAGWQLYSNLHGILGKVGGILLSLLKPFM